MTKQEFLAMSLPNGFKVYDCTSNSIELVEYSNGCPKYVCEAIGQVKNENKCVNVFQAAHDKQLKPILYQLSDLTKEIEHKGEKFVPIDELNNIIDDVGIGFNDHYIDYENPDNTGQIDWLNEPFIVVMWLIEHHFDIYGLIDKGEAIDVNTLQENPYK